MHRNAWLAVLMIALAMPAMAKKQPPVQIAVLKSTHKQHLILQTLISGQKVVLKCRGNCPEIAAGKYVGFIHGSHVDLEFPAPLSNHVEKVSFAVSGSW